MEAPWVAVGLCLKSEPLIDYGEDTRLHNTQPHHVNSSAPVTLVKKETDSGDLTTCWNAVEVSQELSQNTTHGQTEQELINGDYEKSSLATCSINPEDTRTSTIPLERIHHQGELLARSIEVEPNSSSDEAGPYTDREEKHKVRREELHAQYGDTYSRFIKRNSNEAPMPVALYQSRKRSKLAHLVESNEDKKCEKSDNSNTSIIQKSSSVVEEKTRTGCTENQTSADDKPYICSQCDFKFAKKYHLLRHIRTHNGGKVYKFQQCEYTAVAESTFAIHMRKHTGEKPYGCTDCDNKFSYKSTLTAHMKMHTGEKPYKCPHCVYRSAQKDHLFRHMRTHSGEKTYLCSVCAHTTVCSGEMARHMRAHSGKKPHKCSQCDYNTTRHGHLLQHMRKNTEEKPYECSQCAYRSARQCHLVRHTRNHTGEKPYKCSLCVYRFASTSGLVRHMKTHTGVKRYKKSSRPLSSSP